MISPAALEIGNHLVDEACGLAQTFLAIGSAMFVCPDSLSAGDVGERPPPRLGQFHQLGTLVDRVGPVGNQPLSFKKIGDPLHALAGKTERTRRIGNRHRRVVGSSKHLPARAGLPGRFGKRVAFSLQVGGKADHGDGEGGKGIAIRRTFSRHLDNILSYVNNDNMLSYDAATRKEEHMKKTYHGSCHCGRIRYEADIDIQAGTGKCNCSICWKLRYWGTNIKPEDFRLLCEETGISDYQFGTFSGHHRFCANCGVPAYGDGYIEAMGGAYVSINLACLDDLDPAELAEAPVQYFDGRNNSWWTVPAETRHL